MRFKVYTLFAGLLVMALLLGACVPSATPEPKEPATEQMATEAPATEAPATEELTKEEPAEPVTLTYWSYLSETEPLAEILAGNVKTWNENNPNVQVEVSWIGRESITKLRTALLSGEAPDILSHSSSELYPSVVAEGLAYQLDEAFKTPGYNTDQAWGDTFVNLAPHTDGHHYLVPQGYYTSGIYYNIKLFEKYGLEPPETWGEFLEVCQALKENGATPLAVNGAFSFFPSWYFVWLSSRIVGGEQFRAAAQDPTGEAWSDPGFLEAAQQVQYLVDNGYFQDGYEGTNWPGAETLFAEGNVGMYLTGTWFVAEISDKVGEDWEMAVIPFPTVEGGKGDQSAAEAWSNAWLILKDSPNADAAIEFLKYMTSPEAQAEYGTVGTPAAVKGVPLPRYNEGQNAILENADVIYPRLHGIQDDNPEWVTSVFWVVDDQLIFGQLTAEEFIETLKQEQAAFFSK
jgi:ABC-type glycerol-3-phosphate transport system substrate-binding protein